MAKKENKLEEIGFHKGALNTLLKEHNELRKMTAVVEQLVKMHIGALKKLGVDVTSKTSKLDDKVGN